MGTNPQAGAPCVLPSLVGVNFQIKPGTWEQVCDPQATSEDGKKQGAPHGACGSWKGTCFWVLSATGEAGRRTA